MYDTGSEVKTLRAISPQSDSGGAAVNGVVIDRSGFDSLVATFITGATSGNPTGISVACKVQHGNASDGSDMADITGATATITSANSVAEINVDCRGLKKYVRAVETTTLTGGTSPTILVAATITLGQAVEKPV
jgi:hypothetical protein